MFLKTNLKHNSIECRATILGNINMYHACDQNDANVMLAGVAIHSIQKKLGMHGYTHRHVCVSARARARARTHARTHAHTYAHKHILDNCK